MGSFTTMIKDDLKEKYLSMLEGNSSNENAGINIGNLNGFIDNYKSLDKRLKKENDMINDAILKINSDKNDRLSNEKLEKQYRDAISLLEKCASYDIDLNINNVLTCLGNFSYKKMFDLTNSLIDGKESEVINIIEEIYNSGNDLKLFIETYLDFVLDLDKYTLLQSMSCVKVPASMEKDLKYATGLENASSYFGKLVDNILKIKVQIKYDMNIRTTVEAMLLAVCRGVK